MTGRSLSTETITAVATPPGAGGLGIVRVSGPLAPEICETLTGRLPQPRRAELRHFLDAAGETIDSGLVLFFPAPHSFTGEDVVEFQGHGGNLVLQRVLRRVVELGARIARPGEFSERAFLNDKIDLVQAEAIADLIESGSEAATRAAQRSLQGVFSAKVNTLSEELVGIRVFVEAAIDFPDEEIDFLEESDVIERVATALDHLDDLLQQARQGRLLRDGIVMAIIGRPNAGKSSLLNALSGEESAIVTEIPGTTRDVLREHVDIGGIPVHVVDTAGIRETEDRIEAEGVRRARKALAEADIVLLIEDVAEQEIVAAGLESELPRGVPCIRVANKIDLLDRATLERLKTASPGRVRLSARTRQGMDELKNRVLEAVGAQDQAEGSFSARQRHVDAIRRAQAHLRQGLDVMRESRAGELLAEELRLAHRALGEVTGEMLPDDLLGQIFSSFCIGK